MRKKRCVQVRLDGGQIDFIVFGPRMVAHHQKAYPAEKQHREDAQAFQPLKKSQIHEMKWVSRPHSTVRDRSPVSRGARWSLDETVLFLLRAARDGLRLLRI